MRPALIEAISRGTLLFDEVSGAFCNYRIRKRDAVCVVYEIAVPKPFQRQGIGSAFIAALPRPVRLKCTIDNPANNFYASQGFVLRYVEDGRRRQLNVWTIGDLL
jgi:GNAT superfamily N-acetyltransferase